MMTHRLHVDLIANNLANINTTGFKQARLAFQDMLYERLAQNTENKSELRLGGGVRPAAPERLFTQGTLVETQNPTDFAIYGDGFFPVQTPDGQTAYTRDGNFHLDVQGRLVTTDGYIVQPPLVIPPQARETLRVDIDGRVSYTVPGLPPDGPPQRVDVGQILIARFADPRGLEPIGQNLFRATAQSGPPQVGVPNSPGFGQIVHQALEASNVDVADQLTRLLMSQRAYALSARAFSTIDEMLALANSLRR